MSSKMGLVGRSAGSRNFMTAPHEEEQSRLSRESGGKWIRNTGEKEAQLDEILLISVSMNLLTGYETKIKFTFIILSTSLCT